MQMMKSNGDQEQLTPADQQKTRRRRKAEFILMYICLPIAVIGLLTFSLLKLAGRRLPASAWVMAGRGCA